MKEHCAEVDHSDIALICRILDEVIKLRGQEEKDAIDSTIGREIDDISILVVKISANSLEQIEDLHRRLEGLLPRQFFFEPGQ